MKKFILLLLLSCSTQNTHKDYNYFSVLQGPTSRTQTSISVVYPAKLEPKVVFTNSKGVILKPKKIDTHTRKWSPFKLVNYFFSDLKPGEKYNVDLNSSLGFKDKRFFSTLKDPQKFLVASCMSDTHNDIGDIIWKDAFKIDPDLYFLIGDNVYADVWSELFLGIPTDPRHLWDRYIDARIKYKLYQKTDLKPIFALWDDHDYGDNDGNKNYKYKKEAHAIFNQFFARFETDSYKFGPGASSRLSLENHKFYFLDGRYFRDENNGPNHLGKTQKKWLFSDLKNSNATNILIKGDQFVGGNHSKESVEGNHPNAFKKFIEELKINKIKVSFISGDRHFYELMEIEKELLGYKSYEFTSSSIHARVFPGALNDEKNKRRISGVDGTYNYMILKLSNINKKNLDMDVYGLNNKKLDSKSFQLP